MIECPTCAGHKWIGGQGGDWCGTCDGSGAVRPPWIVRGPVFHSQTDEDMLFEWLRRANVHVIGKGENLLCYMKGSSDAKEFKAICARYGLQLLGVGG